MMKGRFVLRITPRTSFEVAVDSRFALSDRRGNGYHRHSEMRVLWLKNFVTFLAVFSVGSVAAEPSAAPPPLPKSISVSRQFNIYGPDVRLRGVVGDLAEQTKKDLLGLLEQRDDWKIPIVLNVQVAAANFPDRSPSGVAVSRSEAGLKIQVDFTLTSQVNPADFQREILRALLIEILCRGRESPSPGTVYPQPPAWLLEGLLARIAGEDRSHAIEPLLPLASAGKLAPLAEVLAQKPELLDAPARSLYRAYCYALVEILLANPHSGPQLFAFIRDLANSSAEPKDVLATHFPAFSGDTARTERVWKEGVQRLLPGERDSLFSVAQTEAALAPLLLVKIAKPPAPPRVYQLEEFTQFLREPGAPAALGHAGRELLVLGLRANPICRPIVAEYQRIAFLLARKKTHGIAERLVQLRSARAELAERARNIEDYLNWFQATQSRSQSGQFADYLQAAKRAAEERPARRDPISVYLSSLETQLQN